MEEDFPHRAESARRQRTQVQVIAVIALVAFLLGAAAVYGLVRSGLFAPGGLLGPDQAEGIAAVEESPPTASTPAPASVAAGAAEARQAVQRVEQVAEQQGGIDQRVAAMEQRLARLDLQMQAAAGNAARAEGLLITFAARRSIERGAPLGYLADQLRLRFGDARPNAVQTVIDAAGVAVTLDQLIARLDGLAPRLAQAPAAGGALSWISRELGELFVIRREDAPSPAAERRLERARLFLESGRVPAAVAEVRLLPNAAPAADWIRDAELYAAAQRALELLETTAILEQRELRDGSGQRVQQPSPVDTVIGGPMNGAVNGTANGAVNRPASGAAVP
jgi:hypothetical protein